MLNLSILGDVIVNKINLDKSQTKKDFAKKMGISRQTLDTYIKNNNMPLDVFNDIIKNYPSILPEISDNESKSNCSNTESSNNYTNVKYYELDSNQTDFATAASHQLPFTDQVDYFLLVRFPALLPDIAKGDIIGISELDPDHFIDTSTIYLFTTDSNTFIKRLEPDTEIDGKLWCHSPIHPKFAIEFSAINKIYKVVYRISHL
jgi:hypothetical protein